MSLELEDQYDNIYRYCFFQLHNKHMAENVTQETFLRFFEQHTYVNRGKPLAYLYTIAKHLCMDIYRKKEEVPLTDTILDTLISEYQPDNKLAVISAVKKLPSKQQELILLRYVNELNMHEISEITGLSRFAIRRRLQAALTQLKETLREEDFY